MAVSSYELVEDVDVGMLVRLPENEVRTLLADIDPARKRHGRRWYRWADIHPYLTRTQIARARRLFRERGMKVRTSKQWVAGYPRLMAEWHPTKNGDIVPWKVSYGSQKRIWWKCPKGPDHEWHAMPKSRTGKLPAGCPFCTGKKVSVTNRLSIHAPEIAVQWHPTKNGKHSPNDFVVGSKFKAWWKCPKAPAHEWQSFIVDRTTVSPNCPFCVNRRISIDRSIAVLAPELARQWHPTKNGKISAKDVGPWSNDPVWWRCERDASHVWDAPPNQRFRAKNRCPFCINRRTAANNALLTLAPHLAAEWHPTKNVGRALSDVRATAVYKVWWKCPNGPDHQWRATVLDRYKKGSKCPFCREWRLSVTNSLAVKHPQLAVEWHPRLNRSTLPSLVTGKSRKKVWWQCQRNKAHVWNVSPYRRLEGESGCPRCVWSLPPGPLRSLQRVDATSRVSSQTRPRASQTLRGTPRKRPQPEVSA